MLGTWTGADDDRATWTIELTPTRFRFTYAPHEGVADEVFTLTGTYEVVREESFILVTVVDALEDGTSVLDIREHWWKGQVSRWAFAPTDCPTGIRVSTHWSERERSDETSEWGDRADQPYGDYWLSMVRNWCRAAPSGRAPRSLREKFGRFGRGELSDSAGCTYHGAPWID